MSIRKIYEQELVELKNDIIKMCRLTITMINNSMSALLNQDTALAQSVVYMDKEVDDLELNIEKKCMRILLKQQPVAKDLREVSSALKMIADIERIGDQASDIADIVCHMDTLPYFKQLTHIENMGKFAIEMVHNSVNSFINNDSKLADLTIKSDDKVDELFIIVRNELVEIIKSDSSKTDHAIDFFMIIKYLERIGDHAVNVCEWTKFNETGTRKKFKH